MSELSLSRPALGEFGFRLSRKIVEVNGGPIDHRPASRRTTAHGEGRGVTADGLEKWANAGNNPKARGFHEADADVLGAAKLCGAAGNRFEHRLSAGRRAG